MPISSPNKRNILFLVGFALLVALGILNLRDQPVSKTKVTSSPYAKSAERDDLADSFIREASQHFFYREFSQAAENYYKAIAIYEERKDFLHVAKTYELLGDLHIMARENAEAEKNYIQAAEYFSQANSNHGQTNSFKNIGDLYLKQGNIDLAKDWYGKALKVNEGGKPHIALGQTQEAMGHLYWKTGDIAEAINSFKQAQNTFASIKYNLGYEHLRHVIQKLTRITRKQQGLETPSSEKSPAY